MVDSVDSESYTIERHDEDLLIPVGSEEIAATRYEPIEAESPRPTLLHYTPYRKDDWGYVRWYPFFSRLVERGYEVVDADLVGTGASTGTKAKPYSLEEGKHAAEIVEWLAEQPWSNGRVGMFGFSYTGMTAMRTAIEAPEPLEAIATLHSGLTTYPRRGVKSSSLVVSGAIGNKAASWFSMIQAMRALPPRRRHSDRGRWATVWRTRLEELRKNEPWLFDFIEHESPKDDYWDEVDMPIDGIQSVDVPHLAVRGFRDSYVHPATKFLPDSDGQTRLVLGPWRHTIPNSGVECQVDHFTQLTEWFDHFLRDKANDMPDRNVVEYWTEWRDGDETDGVWRGRDSWSTADNTTETLSYAVSADGLVPPTGLESADKFEYEYDHTVGVHSVMRTGPAMDPSDDDARSLTFESDPLEQAIELTGTGSATVRFEATTPDPIVAIRVADVSPTGSATLVTNGHLRASHRVDHSDPKPLTPGEEYHVSFPLQPKSYVFREGHRIRVSISAAYFPMMLPTDTHGSILVRSGPEHPTGITFPGRTHGDGPSFSDTIDVPEPIGELATQDEPDVSIETSRDHVAGTASFESTTVRDDSAPPVDIVSESYERSTVAEDDPSSAVIVNRRTISLEYDTETITADVSVRMSRATTQMSTTVCRGEQVVFQETWSI